MAFTYGSARMGGMGHSTPAPCSYSRNTIFIDPDTATKLQLRKAREMCAACPILQQCATDALHSGTTLDGHRIVPADGVFQAGVHCQGDRDTAVRLATVAGVAVPNDYREAPERLVPRDQCRHCGAPMVKWTREAVPEGYVMHHARNFCAKCRKAYSRYVADRPRRVTKPVDRHRHHPTGRRREGSAVSSDQLHLF